MINKHIHHHSLSLCRQGAHSADRPVVRSVTHCVVIVVAATWSAEGVVGVGVGLAVTATTHSSPPSLTYYRWACAMSVLTRYSRIAT